MTNSRPKSKTPVALTRRKRVSSGETGGRLRGGAARLATASALRARRCCRRSICQNPSRTQTAAATSDIASKTIRERRMNRHYTRRLFSSAPATAFSVVRGVASEAKSTDLFRRHKAPVLCDHSHTRRVRLCITAEGASVVACVSFGVSRRPSVAPCCR
jgi:hypothetical protein